MIEIYVKNKSDNYHYESFVDDINGRDKKYKELKARGYKKITIGEYKSGE